MHHAHEFLQALTTVLCVAAVTTILFQRLRLPVVLGYILAGLLVGPHVTVFPLIVDRQIVQTLSELGVILLMFSLGLEFSLSKLVKVGASALLTAVIEVSVVLWLGLLAARLAGWTPLESLFAGAALAISSTTIIAKAFAEEKVNDRLRQFVFAILLVEDLLAVLLMAALTPIGSGSALSGGLLAATAGRLFIFLIALVAIGMLVVPRATRAVLRLDNAETTLVASVGFCFATAFLALKFGYSVALGAFIAGSLVAESREEKKIEHLVQPVRDMFAAIFFVSVGVMFDPGVVVRHWGIVLTFTCVVLFGKIIAVSFGAFLGGNGVRNSIRAAMSMAQIGEFSFIIATLALTLKAARPDLFAIAIAVSAITTLLTPFLIRASDRVASAVDRRLPRTLQTYAALYGGWVERLRSQQKTKGSPLPRLFLMLGADLVLIAALIVGTSVYLVDLGTLIEQQVGAPMILARAAVLAAAVALGIPLWFGVVRVVRRISTVLAERAFPRVDEGALDLSAAPRTALVVTLKIVILVLVGMPIVALSQPFVPGYPAAIALSLLLVMLVIGFWRSARDLQGHVQAGAQAIVGVLSLAGRSTQERSVADDLLSAYGSPRVVVISETSPARGRTLREINLRGRTGATLLAIHRGDQRMYDLTATDTIEEGDIVAIAGTGEAVEAAAELLRGA